jgi:hypothetical protein
MRLRVTWKRAVDVNDRPCEPSRSAWRRDQRLTRVRADSTSPPPPR